MSPIIIFIILFIESYAVLIIFFFMSAYFSDVK